MINGMRIKIDAVRILSFSVKATIAKIIAKIKIKVVNKIPKSRLKFICPIYIIDSFIPLHIRSNLLLPCYERLGFQYQEYLVYLL